MSAQETVDRAGPEGGGERDAELRRAELLAWCIDRARDLDEALAWAERMEAFVTGGGVPFAEDVAAAPPRRAGEMAESPHTEGSLTAREGAAAAQGERQRPQTCAAGAAGHRASVLALIERAAAEGRRCPSNSEIARAVGVGTQAASAIVLRLARAGDIVIEESGPAGRVVFVPRLGKRTARLPTRTKATRRSSERARARPPAERAAKAPADTDPHADTRDGAPAASGGGAVDPAVRAAVPDAFSKAQREAVLTAIESLTTDGGERVQAVGSGLWRVEGRRATAEDLVKRASHRRCMAGLAPIAWPEGRG